MDPDAIVLVKPLPTETRYVYGVGESPAPVSVVGFQESVIFPLLYSRASEGVII